MGHSVKLTTTELLRIYNYPRVSQECLMETRGKQQPPEATLWHQYSLGTEQIH